MRFLSPGRVRTARRVTGSAAVLGIAAAVAGLATHSTFIDTAGPLDTRIDAGVLSLALRADGVAATRPFEGSALLAGDSVDQPLDLVNDGTAPFGSIRMSMTATSSSILDTDTANGLQLAVRSCPVPWTGSGDSWSSPARRDRSTPAPWWRRRSSPAPPASRRAGWTTCCSPPACPRRPAARASRGSPAR
jgi:hypothetical protein